MNFEISIVSGILSICIGATILVNAFNQPVPQIVISGPVSLSWSEQTRKGMWHHSTIISDKATSSLYIDGLLISKQITVGEVTQDQQDPRVSNRVWTPEEVKTRYLNGANKEIYDWFMYKN